MLHRKAVNNPGWSHGTNLATAATAAMAAMAAMFEIGSLGSHF